MVMRAFRTCLMMAAFSVTLMGAAVSLSAQAAVSNDDVKIITRSLGYIRGLRSDDGVLRVAIVYDAADPSSLQEARSVQDIMDATLDFEGGRLEPVLVPVGALGQAAGSQVIYVARGLGGYYDRLREFASQNRIFNISLDRSCADSGSCVVAVQTGGRVRVFLNVEAMESSGFDVDAAFRYMAVRV